MIPVHVFTGKVDRKPARQIGRLRIGARIGFEQHRLFVEAANSHADHRLPIAMVIVAKLRKLLAGDEEGRLAVRQPFLGLGQCQGGLPHALQNKAHRVTNSFKTFGYSSASAGSTRCSSVSAVSSTSIGTSACPKTFPASSSSVTRCTEQPLTLSPAAIARA